ncbi:CBS domain and cyclic nucleotide-regulated nucleotidyltransferase [Croceitalea dokdonensis DOKDO 023]|uniref:CBS domain and cyclic nucleotide-regulated nucleotidyltransferase n=1 Tax=Croceitalea dokdonensis DOKDO 023 TaxID=1300341 RepID=A0A0P7AP41_9FLAO|nr:DUF294 nucleotidyltransferase-like domain-containing protein [Croceitalea dokdonensis]KPM33834.1 CBS domain and cyclic nucleotide-regulated nucleotidyltransferase [Croceitalea dokdonensis DOKDO 023]
MQNSISYRIADFLKRFPPFSNIPEATLQEIATEVNIVYKEKGSVIFKQGEATHPHYYVVHKGAISLWSTHEQLCLDICDEGDIFGLRPLMANDSYRLDALAEEESILYAIPIAVFRPLAKNNSAVTTFLVESFASNTRNPYASMPKGQLLGDTVKFDANRHSTDFLDFQPVTYTKDLVTATSNERIATLAKAMTMHRIGAILITENQLPLGIITDKDLRNKIATGLHSITENAASIMSTPVITYPAQLSVAQAQMGMMKNHISHLVLTEDGTTNTKAIGVLSKHDIMLSLGNNPAVLVKAIKRSKSVEEIKSLRMGVMNLLRGYLKQNIPMALTANIIAELNDVCIKQIITLTLQRMTSGPPVPFAWLALGSQGRKEQLLHTDQDNALVFANVPDGQLPTTQSYFLELGKKITAGLHAIGYDYCPAGMMASNPKWCQSLDGYRRTISAWITNPGPNEVLLSSIFFDYSLVYGDAILISQLSKHITKTIRSSPIFLSHLAKDALMSPSPTGFFRQFLVEQDGEHRDYFDLKKRALMPLIDAARVLTLSEHITGISNTWDRFKKLAEIQPQNAELFLACSYASKALLKFRTKQGLAHNDSGRFISLDKLTKEEKVKLKRTFKSIKGIQELINTRFMVSRLQ